MDNETLKLCLLVTCAAEIFKYIAEWKKDSLGLSAIRLGLQADILAKVVNGP
jgi:hypothetical protein